MKSANEKLSRRQVLRGSLGTTLGLALGTKAAGVAGAERPNIVMIILDALRAMSLPMYGCRRNTAPFLQDLSARSTLYRRCYSTSPWTRPAVTSLLTGLTPLEHGNSRPDRPFPVAQPTFPQVLGWSGYRTGFFSANFIVAAGYGMENHFEHVSFESAGSADGYRLIRECQRWLSKLPAGPVCAYVHFFQPHGPYDPPPDYIDMSLALARKEPISVDYLPPYHRDVNYALGNHCILGRIPHHQAAVCYSSDPLRYVMLYEANILFADSLLAEFISQWQDLRSGQRTIFIVTSDHGECMGEHGHFFDHGKMLTDTLLHVPLVVHDTANPIGREISSPISHMDLPNEILEWAGSSRKLDRAGNAGTALKEVAGSNEHIIVSQHVPFNRGVLQKAEIGCAVTLGSWRLVYNDCPFMGNHCVLDVLFAGEPSAQNARGPQPIPLTALQKPQKLAHGVILESLGIHTIYVEAGKPYKFSGQLRLSAETTGTLALRVRAPGQDPALLGEFVCEGDRVQLKGVLPRFKHNKNEETSPVAVCEASWRPKQVQGQENPAAQAPPNWCRLFMFPVFSPQLASEDLQLVGLDLETPVACPGDSVLVTLVRRFLDKLEERPIVSWRLLDENREAVLEGQSSVDLVHVGSRLSQSSWFQIPPHLAPGDYAFEFKITDKGTPFIAGTLRVARNQQDAFLELVKRDARLAGFRKLHSESLLANGQKEELISAVKRLAERYPEEGHFSFLLAELAKNPDERMMFLQECLAKTPLHRAALAHAAKESWGQSYVDTLQQLTPKYKRNYEFQNGIRLFGFDLMRAPNHEKNSKNKNLYLKLYWESLASNSKPYAVDLWIQIADQQKILFWFVGTGRHPTCEWKIGEAVVETINVPLPKDTKEVRLALWLFRYWDFAYAGMKASELNRYYVTSYGPEGLTPQGAELGTFICDDLPVSNTDLLERKRQNKTHYQLYDLSADPLERHNRVDDRPDMFHRMQTVLLPLLDTRQETEVAEAQGVELSEETKEKLRALGYIR